MHVAETPKGFGRLYTLGTPRLQWRHVYICALFDVCTTKIVLRPHCCERRVPSQPPALLCNSDTNQRPALFVWRGTSLCSESIFRVVAVRAHAPFIYRKELSPARAHTSIFVSSMFVVGHIYYAQILCFKQRRVAYYLANSTGGAIITGGLR